MDIKENEELEERDKKISGIMKKQIKKSSVRSGLSSLKEENMMLHNKILHLQDSNSKLQSRIAELFTLQEIQKAIGTILDVRDLLVRVNDIIIGVMGVSNSTIVLYDEKRDSFNLHITNIFTEKDMKVLEETINCKVFYDVIGSNCPIMVNGVNSKIYTFTKGREVNSLICVPLAFRGKKFGIIFAEHNLKYSNIFSEENLKFFEIIGQQVSMAMDNAALYEEKERMANTDGLTEIYNRLYFNNRIKIEIEQSKNENYELSLAIMDIDFFKKFNDTYGHLFGDVVLKRIATLVKTNISSTDILARFGGEEFIMLFPKTAIQEAYAKLENIRKLIENTKIKYGKISASVTASFGLHSNHDKKISDSLLIKYADDALYEAKQSGRNCIKMIKHNAK